MSRSSIPPTPGGGCPRVRARGYFAARVSDVARRAGIADGTIHLYFRNKEDILVSLFDEVMSGHAARVTRGTHADFRGDGEAARDRRASPAALGENQELAVVFQVELSQSTKFLERFTSSWFHDYFDLLAGVIEASQRDGTLRADLRRKVLAKALFGALDPMVTSWILGRRNYALGELAAPAVDLFFRGAQPPERTVGAGPLRALASGSGGR